MLFRIVKQQVYFLHGYIREIYHGSVILKRYCETYVCFFEVFFKYDPDSAT